MKFESFSPRLEVGVPLLLKNRANHLKNADALYEDTNCANYDTM